MASGVEELLDMLFEMIDEAKNAPLSCLCSGLKTARPCRRATA